MVELFLDTAEIDEVRKATALGVISGVTTNPKLAAQSEPGSFRKRIGEILACCAGPVSVEVVSESVDDMMREACEYASWDNKVVVKIPMMLDGLEVIHRLERERDIRVNVTCMMSSNQALLAMMAGASFVSLFVGRINDLGYDADAVIRETAEFINRGDFNSRIIAGSIRQLADIQRSFLAGAHIVTTPFKFLPQLCHHPRTVETIDEFKQAWEHARDRGGLS